MSYIDLTTYDILDLIPSSSFSDDMKGEFLNQFVTAYGGYLSECLGTKFTEEDSEELDILLSDEDATPQEVEEFFKDKIPNYDEFLTGVALKFKKDYLLQFYKMMKDSTIQSHHFSSPLWDEIIALATEDEWDSVSLKIQEMEEKDKQMGKNVYPVSNQVPSFPPV